MKKETARKEQRILGRTLAKELSREELEQINGSSFEAQRPPISTLVATLPTYEEDQ